MATKYNHLNTTITDAGTRFLSGTNPSYTNPNWSDVVDDGNKPENKATLGADWATNVTNISVTNAQIVNLDADKLNAKTITASVNMNSGGYLKVTGSTSTSNAFGWQGTNYNVQSSMFASCTTTGTGLFENVGGMYKSVASSSGNMVGVIGFSNNTGSGGNTGVIGLGSGSGVGVSGQTTGGWGVSGVAYGTAGEGGRFINVNSGYYVELGTNTRSISASGPSLFDGQVRMVNLPTSSSGLSTGDLWNDSGTLKIV